MKLGLFQQIVELNQSFDRLIGGLDAKWAYKFQREFSQKLKDPDDIYLEVRDSEERRKRKGLPPRVVTLPNWDMSDEDRYDKEQCPKRKNAGTRRHRKSLKSSKKARATTRGLGHLATPKKGGYRP